MLQLAVILRSAMDSYASLASLYTGYLQSINHSCSYTHIMLQVFEEAMKTWMEKVHLDPPSTEEHPPHELSEAEISLLQSFVEATESLIKK